MPASLPAPASSVGFVLDPNGTSHVAWPFNEPGWAVVTGSASHRGDDFHADDWNYGTGDDDLGMTAIAAAPGIVLFAGRHPEGEPFDAYGNQVVVHVVDQQNGGGATEFAYRYAHLASIAAEVGDYVHFGSEIGTVGGTGEEDDSYSPHLHSVLYKDIYATATGSARSGIENLEFGFSPSATLGPAGAPASIFAAAFDNAGAPYATHSEALPCSTWNGDKDACNDHSFPWGGQTRQDCAYYLCSGLCLPRGVSNCRANCSAYCDPNDNDEDGWLPCHLWDGDEEACNERSYGVRDCAYYVTTDKCRPRGTPNCMAGIEADCF